MTIIRSPALIALATWLTITPAVFVLPEAVDLSPFTQRGADLPLAVGGVLLAVLAGVAMIRRGPVVAGICAGVFAGYVVLVLRTSLHGTPFP